MFVYWLQCAPYQRPCCWATDSRRLGTWWHWQDARDLVTLAWRVRAAVTWIVRSLSAMTPRRTGPFLCVLCSVSTTMTMLGLEKGPLVNSLSVNLFTYRISTAIWTISVLIPRDEMSKYLVLKATLKLNWDYLQPRSLWLFSPARSVAILMSGKVDAVILSSASEWQTRPVSSVGMVWNMWRLLVA